MVNITTFTITDINGDEHTGRIASNGVTTITPHIKDSRCDAWVRTQMRYLAANPHMHRVEHADTGETVAVSAPQA